MRRGQLDVAEVGSALAQRCRHGDDGDVEAVDVVERRDRSIAARGQRAVHDLVGDVLHVRVAGVETLDSRGVGIEPDDVEPGLDRPHRDRKTDITLADTTNGTPPTAMGEQKIPGVEDGLGHVGRGVGVAGGDFGDAVDEPLHLRRRRARERQRVRDHRGEVVRGQLQPRICRQPLQQVVALGALLALFERHGHRVLPDRLVRHLAADAVAYRCQSTPSS